MSFPDFQQLRMSDVGERLQLGGEEGADVADVDSSLMWRPHNTEVRKGTTWTSPSCGGRGTL